MNNNKALAIIASIIGVIFIILAGMYWFTPAGSLPHFFPGYLANSVHIHYKHGLGFLILGLVLFAYAWFKTGSKPAGSTINQ